jgi:type I restriction enzyme S subunit
MTDKLKRIGIKDSRFLLVDVATLIKEKVLDKPLDGNHGEIHPKSNDFVPFGIPFIMASDLENGQIKLEKCNHISEKQAAGLRKGFAKEKDVILTHKATIGRTAVVGKSKFPFLMLTPQTTYYRVSDYERLNNKYLRCYFEGSLFQQTLKLWAGSGSTRAYIGITAQQKLPIILPPVDIQKKIAAVLSAYDDLIDNNNRRIALLEKMAEELYREWFLRMRFPEHEKTKLNKGIPAGWTISNVESLGSVRTGKTPSTKNSRFYGEDFMFIKTPDMHDNLFINETELSLSQEGLNSQPSQTLPANSICVSCIGSAGVVSITTKKSQTNQQINSVILNNNEFLEWAFFTLRSLKPLIELFGGTGATMTNLSKGKFSGLLFVKPTDSLIKMYHLKTYKTFQQIKVLGAVNLNIKKSRDMLLSRLISGKVSIEGLDIRFPASMQEGSQESALKEKRCA